MSTIESTSNHTPNHATNMNLNMHKINSINTQSTIAPKHKQSTPSINPNPSPHLSNIKNIPHFLSNKDNVPHDINNNIHSQSGYDNNMMIIPTNDVTIKYMNHGLVKSEVINLAMKIIIKQSKHTKHTSRNQLVDINRFVKGIMNYLKVKQFMPT